MAAQLTINTEGAVIAKTTFTGKPQKTPGKGVMQHQGVHSTKAAGSLSMPQWTEAAAQLLGRAIINMTQVTAPVANKKQKRRQREHDQEDEKGGSGSQQDRNVPARRGGQA